MDTDWNWLNATYLILKPKSQLQQAKFFAHLNSKSHTFRTLVFEPKSTPCFSFFAVTMLVISSFIRLFQRYKIAGISNSVTLIGLRRHLQQCWGGSGILQVWWPLLVYVCAFLHSTVSGTLHHCRCFCSAYDRAPWGKTSVTAECWPRSDTVLLICSPSTPTLYSMWRECSLIICS